MKIFLRFLKLKRGNPKYLGDYNTKEFENVYEWWNLLIRYTKEEGFDLITSGILCDNVIDDVCSIFTGI